MAKFRVNFMKEIDLSFVVEAKNSDEARDIAQDMLYKNSIEELRKNKNLDTDYQESGFDYTYSDEE